MSLSERRATPCNCIQAPFLLCLMLSSVSSSLETKMGKRWELECVLQQVCCAYCPRPLDARPSTVRVFNSLSNLFLPNSRCRSLKSFTGTIQAKLPLSCSLPNITEY